eukprot:TRINITY_DN88785_c0_g1_i1.p1 TRINITY_DN88785_c0_g1~~TRINITY_DN88785_c0_g1_i1.p1  ORF type:complete len:587 (-),score=118.79 TRINITY_DN88785_c0_g1_i1:403-2163(-)
MLLLRKLACLYGVNAFGNRNNDVSLAQLEGVDDDSDDDSDSDGSGVSVSKFKPMDREEMISKNGPDPELWTDGKLFCSVVALASLANVQAQAMEAELDCSKRSHCEQSGAIWYALEHVFTALFVIEIIVRFADAGPRRFLVGERTKVKYKIHAMNVFDVVIVFLRVLDVWLLGPLGIDARFRQLSVFRIVRFGPCVKHYASSAIRELSIVVGAVYETMKTLFFVILMLLFVILVFSVLVRMAVMVKPRGTFNYEHAEWHFEEYWGSVARSSLSLFQVSTKDKWGTLVLPLIEADGTLTLLFGGFFIVAALALMNSIVGVVVQSTLANSSMFAEEEKKEREKIEKLVMQSLREIFRDADTDHSGELDLEELHAIIKKWEVRERLRMLQIPFSDLDALFELLDEENTGSVNIDMFFRACAKMRGQAKAVDLHQLNIDLRLNLDRCDDHSATVFDANKILAGVLSNVDDIDVSVMHDDMDQKDPVYVRRQSRDPKDREARYDPGRHNFSSLRPEKRLWQELEGTATVSKTSEAKSESASVKGYGNMVPEGSLPPPPPLPAHVQQLAEYTKAARKQASQGKKLAKVKERR